MSRTIIAEDSVEFLDQDEFRARKMIVVGKKYTFTKGGQAHRRDRCIAHKAYCYEEVTVRPKA